MKQAAVIVGLVLASGTASAGQWTTGIIDEFLNPGQTLTYVADLPVTNDAALEMRYGLWNSPDVTMNVYVNGTFVFTAIADQGYISPGPEFIAGDVTGLLIEGANTIEVEHGGGGEAVMGALTLDWGPYLVLSGGCGGSTTFDMSGLTPGATYGIGSADGPGAAVIPQGNCAGTVLGLGNNNLRLRGTGTADANGDASRTFTIPAAACGSWVQVVDLGSCAVTDAMMLP